MGQESAEIRREIAATRERMGETAEQLGYQADIPARLRDRVNDRIDTVKATINNAVSGVTTTVTGKAQDVSAGGAQRAEQARIAAAGAAGMAAENPLGLMLGAVAVGFLAGLMLPMSDVERRSVKPIGRKIADKAQTAMNETVEAGKAVVRETAAAAMSSMQQHAATVVQHTAASESDAAASEPRAS